MSVCYVESSALLHWLLNQNKSADIVSKINAAEVVCTSRLTFIECERCLIRAEHMKEMLIAERLKAQGWLSVVESEWNIMEIDVQIRKAISHKFPIEPVRTLDAIHLATALQFSVVYQDLKVLSLDSRIIDNLVPLGLKAY